MSKKTLSKMLGFALRLTAVTILAIHAPTVLIALVVYKLGEKII